MDGAGGRVGEEAEEGGVGGSGGEEGDLGEGERHVRNARVSLVALSVQGDLWGWRGGCEWVGEGSEDADKAVAIENQIQCP